MVNELGARARQLRREAGLTLEALSALAGVSARTISNIERGAIVRPQQHTLVALLDALQAGEEVRLELHHLSRQPRDPAVEDRPTLLPPSRLTDFAGRSAELERLELLLDPARGDRRPVVISGAAGVGKTSTAVEALRRVKGAPAQQLFVDLDGLGEAPLSPLHVLQSLLIQLLGPERVPSTLDEALVAWRSATRDAPVFVLLDNAVRESQLRPALSAGPSAVVVITARSPLLGLQDVLRVTLDPLPRADSIRLLERIVPASQRADGRLDELAAACGDLPLALRIAGNRIAARPRWSTDDFLARLHQSRSPLDDLVAGDLAVHAALMLSYNQLGAVSQRVFRSLSTFHGTTFDTALVATANQLDRAEAARQLDDLVELGLVTERGRDRYALHDLVRFFSARQASQEQDDVEPVRRRAQQWLLASAGNASLMFGPAAARSITSPLGCSFPSAAAARDWLTLEAQQWMPAAKGAFEPGELEELLDTASDLRFPWDVAGSRDQWRSLYTVAAAAASPLGRRALLAWHHGYLTHALVQHDAGATDSGGWALLYRGWVHATLRQFEAAGPLGDEALELLEQADDVTGLTQALLLVGYAAHGLDDGRKAERVFRRLAEVLASRRGAFPPEVHRLMTGIAEGMLTANQAVPRPTPSRREQALRDVMEEGSRATSGAQPEDGPLPDPASTLPLIERHPLPEDCEGPPQR